MNLPGIECKFTPEGKLREVCIDATLKSDFIENLLDLIFIEETKNDLVKPFDEVVSKLDKKHGIKR